MKKIIKNTSLILMLVLMIVINACQDVELPTAVSSTQANGSTAKFLFVNASPDAPPLDLFINGAKVSFPAPNAYATVPIFGNGTSSNTSLFARAATGTIGGVLGSKDIVFRFTTTGQGNFTAIDQANINGANYSVFAVDTITRPKPLRTFNSSNIGDVTFFVKNTGSQISIVDYNALGDKTTVVPIGLVSVGTTDPGGPRFWISQDIFRAPSAFNNSQAEIRVLNAVPNSNPTLLYVQLVDASANKTPLNSSGNSYFMSVAAPTVVNPLPAAIASRSLTGSAAPNLPAPFTLTTIATAGVPNVYTVEVSTDKNFATVIASATLTGKTFTPGKSYTIYLSGLFAKGRTISTNIIQHN